MIKCSFVYLTLLLTSAISYAQYPNVRVNKPTSINPEEVTISINPLDRLNLAAGANINYIYRSTDGGFSWSETLLTSHDFGVWGDPCVVFDPAGNLYYGHLSNPPPPGYWIDRIVVQKSTDGGASWDNGRGIGYNPPTRMQDKEWIAADATNSPYRNNVYVAWTEFDVYGSTDPSDSTRILFSRTTDAGLSWSPPVRISDAGGNCIDSDSTVEGAVPAVGPGGEVYVSWSGPLGIMFDKSTDGGITFGEDIFVTDQPGGWDIDVPGIYRCNGMPVTASDISNSIYQGNIYVQWSDQRNGTGNTDIFIIRSTDKGESWGPVTKVNDDLTNRHQFFSWMTVDQSNGNIYVVFYDRRNTGGDSTEVYVAKSTDGGETFHNFRVSDSPFKPRADIFFGDYTNIASLNGKIYPIWMRMDSTILSVWNTVLDEQEQHQFKVDTGWNMISLPQIVDDPRSLSLFPGSVTSAFTYDGSYIPDDSLNNGKGYWIKYDLPDVISTMGVSLNGTKIALNAGWNMIGTIAFNVPVGFIESDPPGIDVSGFFDYRDGLYSIVDTLRPGRGYWVKSSVPGKLVLRNIYTLAPEKRINIAPDGELPPNPPVAKDRLYSDGDALSHNYPNPFNTSTVIQYTLPGRSRVRLNVYDVLGQKVASPADCIQDAGKRSVIFDGSKLPSGLYIYRLNVNGFTETKKIILMK